MTKTPVRRRRKVLSAAGGLLASSAVLAACSSAPAATGGNSSGEVTLVVYSAQGYDHAEVAAFHKATGIPVKLDDNSTGPLLTQIEASRNNPNWGLLWVDGPAAFAGLDQQGLLVKHWEPKVGWNSLGRSNIPADRSYVPTGITFMAAVVYDSKKVANPPTTWQQLLSSKWKGAVGTNDPSQSGPTYSYIAGMMQHLGSVAAGKQYFLRLKANGLVIHPTNGPTLQALTSGQIKLAVVQSSAGVGAALGDKSLRVEYPNPTTELPSCIGIDAKVSKKEQQEAEQFASFVLSKQGQKVMQSGDPTGDSLYYPVVHGVQPLSALPPLSSIEMQRINPYLWGSREAAINTWFDAKIVQ